MTLAPPEVVGPGPDRLKWCRRSLSCVEVGVKHHLHRFFFECIGLLCTTLAPKPDDVLHTGLTHPRLDLVIEEQGAEGGGVVSGTNFGVEQLLDDVGESRAVLAVEALVCLPNLPAGRIGPDAEVPVVAVGVITEPSDPVDDQRGREGGRAVPHEPWSSTQQGSDLPSTDCIACTPGAGCPPSGPRPCRAGRRGPTPRRVRGSRRILGASR